MIDAFKNTQLVSLTDAIEMKNNHSLRDWRQIASLALIVLVGENVTRQSAMAQSVTKDAMLRDIVRNVIVPDHQELAVKCHALTVAVEQLVKAPTPESLEKTRQAWIAALLGARQIQWLQTGPIADREYLSTFYFGKVLPVRIEDVLNSSRVIDDSYLDELGATTKGMFTLEYLVFDERSESSAKASTNAVADTKRLFGTNVQRRCQFLLALANDVRRKAANVSVDWASTNRQDAAAKFAAGGQETLNGLVNQMAKVLENVAENHLHLALQLPAPVMRQLDRIEGGRSRTSLPQLIAIVRGTHKVYRGGEGKGIDDYLRELNRSLESRVEQQFQKALSALQAIDAPLEEAVTERKESVQLAYQTVRDLEILFKVDLASALGVTITFNSNDGD